MMQQNFALSITEVSKITGFGRTKIYEMLKTGELPAKKLGKRTVILKSDLDVFLLNLESYPVQEREVQ